jgi:hypothetical protein
MLGLRSMIREPAGRPPVAGLKMRRPSVAREGEHVAAE